MPRIKSITRTRGSTRKSPASAESLRSDSGLAGKKVVGLLCIALVAITIAIYSPVLGHSFVVLDDREYVTANSHIHGLEWDTIKWAFTSTVAANWHPLTWLSHALDYQLFALNPMGHHLASVLIHTLNALLLYLGLLWITKRGGPSLLVAALFALHPINVESVAWVAERKNVLSTLFLLLALGAYAWYAQKPGWRRYLLVAGLFTASLMAKPMAVTLPFVLLLMDYWPLKRMLPDDAPSPSGAQPATWLKLVLEKIPLLFLSAASSWMTLKAQRTVVQSFNEFSFASRIQNGLVAYGLYLWKMIWPAQLAFYPHSLGTLPAWQWLLSATVLIGVTAFVIKLRNRRYLPVGWFWFLGTLVPVLGLVQVGEYAMADRYAYVPLLGIFIMIAWGLADLAEAKHVRPVWCVIPGVCVLAALSSATVHQIGYWESDYDLYTHTLDVSDSPFAHNAVGMALMNANSEMTRRDLENFPSEPMRVDEARRHFERALELRQSQNPNSSLWDRARTLNNLGNLDRMQNRLDQARQHDEDALKIYRQLAQQNPEMYLPYVAVTLNNLGAVERLQNHLDEADKDYQESLKINRQLAEQDPAKYLPNVAMVLNEYGLVAASQNRIEDARVHYEEALKIDRQLAGQSPDVYLPQLAMTLNNFALFDAFQQNLDDARLHYEEALGIDRELAKQNSSVYLPNLAMTLSNLGRVDRMLGRNEESRGHYQEALSILEVLAQSGPQYAAEVARVKSNLAQLEKPGLLH
jgi:tetratricopeptide (TPR) repeat protein